MPESVDNSDLEKLYELEINEGLQVYNNVHVLRVPGGWIYGINERYGVFVPYVSKTEVLEAIRGMPDTYLLIPEGPETRRLLKDAEHTFKFIPETEGLLYLLDLTKAKIEHELGINLKKYDKLDTPYGMLIYRGNINQSKIKIEPIT